MKKICLAILCFVVFQQVNAQTNQAIDTVPLYKKFPVLPVFSIMAAPDSTKFTKSDLKKRKKTLIMLFSPDCSHCQVATQDLLDHINLFKDVQIVMVSSLDFNHIKKFYEDYKIAQYPNITMGRDGSYYLGNFFKLHNYPSLFLYDKKGKFVESFEGSVKMENIAATL